MDVSIEGRVQSLVAAHLGVDPSELAGDVSLTDDLAVDSLDLAEIAVAIEEALGVVLPRAFLDDVRTCAELVERTLREIARRRSGCETARVPAGALRARIVAAGKPPSWYLERTVALDPYAVETIADDVRYAGPARASSWWCPTGPTPRRSRGSRCASRRCRLAASRSISGGPRRDVAGARVSNRRAARGSGGAGAVRLVTARAAANSVPLSLDTSCGVGAQRNPVTLMTASCCCCCIEARGVSRACGRVTLVTHR